MKNKPRREDWEAPYLSPEQRKNLQELVEALRSGEFKQGEGWLRAHTYGQLYYCCLGVACELYRRKVENAPDWKSHKDSSLEKYAYMHTASFLPEPVRKHFGFESEDPTLPHPEESTFVATLTELNDGGWDFNEIADAIEASLLSDPHTN